MKKYIIFNKETNTVCFIGTMEECIIHSGIYRLHAKDYTVIPLDEDNSIPLENILKRLPPEEVR